MTKEDILILGGNGFIGRALTRRLVGEGMNISVISTNAGPTRAPENVRYLQGSLDDPELLAKTLPFCSTVFHLASTTTPGSSALNPALEIENIVPTLRLIEALQRHPDTHLVFLSSGGTIYGNPQNLPVREDAPPCPLSFHGAGKVAMEAMLQALRSRGQSVTILRPSNAYGPGQRLKSGFGLVRTILEHLLRGTAIEIWGDGQTVRDYVFVDDIASACRMIIDRPGDCETYNVGSGVGYSIDELVALAGAITGHSPCVTHRPGRSGDVSKVVLSVEKLHTLGWTPATSLESGLSQTWAWLQETLV